MPDGASPLMQALWTGRWSDEAAAEILAKAPPFYEKLFDFHDARIVKFILDQNRLHNDGSCNEPTRGDMYRWCDMNMHARISRESLSVFMSRLLKLGISSPRARLLAEDIDKSIEIELDNNILNLGNEKENNS